MVTTHTVFVYDDWNPVGEYSITATLTSTLSKSYLWGMDLSGSMQGAGGVGGLLSVHQHGIDPNNQSPIINIYSPTFDGNGNISEYLDATGIIVAHYEYDVFGNTIVKTGTLADNFAHRFSTKYLDTETGLYYYGYRYYDPVTGRWPSRDPIEERGGVNLYGFVGNDGVNKFDYLGFVELLDELTKDLTCGTLEVEGDLFIEPYGQTAKTRAVRGWAKGIIGKAFKGMKPLIGAAETGLYE